MGSYDRVVVRCDCLVISEVGDAIGKARGK
jgi:hypothetical protein